MISALEAEALTVARGGRVLAERLSFRVVPGEALAVTGPNGAGKTSLLRVLAGLLRPAEGRVRYVGVPDAPGESLHWLGWRDGLKDRRTVEEELRFWSAWHGPSGSDPAQVDAALEAMDLARQRNVEVRRLSAGQRRRLALARLLAPHRPVWLLDEPLAPLDAAWRARIGDLMGRHLADGGMVVAAVHDPLPLAARELPLGAA